MKRVLFVLTIIILLTGILFGLISIIKHNQEESKTVQLGYYSESNYLYIYGGDIAIAKPEDDYKNVGPVINAETAIKKAKDVILEYLIQDEGKKADPLDRYIFNTVLYDENCNSWCVEGVLPAGYDGVTPMVIIRDNGDVVAAWWSWGYPPIIDAGQCDKGT